MSKISEQKALEAYPKASSPYYDDHILDRNVNCRAGYIQGYDQALFDIKVKIQELIRQQEKEHGVGNVDFGLYTILGHIIGILEE